MTTLDFLAARAVAQAKLLERAVHHRGPWEMEIAGMRVEAVRIVTPSRVVFSAYFASVPEGDTSVAWLYCEGEVLTSREIDVPESGSFFMEWSLGGSAPQPVGV